MKLTLSFISIFAILLCGYSQDELTVEKFISKVVENDFSIQIVKNETVIAANENNIGNAGYLPSLFLEGSQDLTVNSARQEFLGNQVNEADNAQNTAFQVGALLDWTIFDGFKMFATDKKLDLLEETAQLNLRAEIEIKVYQAYLLFYSYLLHQEMQEIFQQSIDLSKARFDYIEKRVKNGAASKTELIQSQLDLSADSSAFLSNQNELELIQAELNEMMAQDASTSLQVVGDLPQETENFDVESFKSNAFTDNTNLLMAKSNMAVLAQERKEVVSRFYPSIGVYAGYNFNQAENEVGFLLRNRTYGPSFGVTLRWNIIDNLSRFQDLKNIKIQQENAELFEKQEKQIIDRELTQAFSNLNWAKKNMDFELRNQIKRSEITEITEKALKAGSITPLELREIQFSAVEANERLLQAQLDYITAKLNLFLTTGAFGNGQVELF